MKRALVVDDEFAELEVLSMVLEAEGFHVDRAGHGGEALPLLAAHRYDMVMCDVAMPVMSGLALLAEVQRSELLHGALFVFLVHRYEPRPAMGVPVLLKPLRIASLRALLDSAQTT